MDRFLPIFSQVIAQWEALHWVWVTVGLGVLLIMVLVYWGFQAFQNQRIRQEAERLLRNWQSQLNGYFDEVPKVMDRAGLLQYATEIYSGKTSELIDGAIYQADELNLTTRSGQWLLAEVEALVFPSNRSNQFFNLFRRSNYENAINLLKSESVGFRTNEQRLDILYSNSDHEDFRNLLGREEDYPSFKLSLEALFSGYPERLSEAEAALDRIEYSLEQLPVWLTDVGAELDQLGQQVHRSVVASRKDGFFPLINLQEKLLPSVINLIDECIRQGALDPISAFESAAKLAMRQMQDIRKITDRIELLRTRDFPLLEKAREIHQFDPMIYTWIDSEMIAHSTALESICNHAVLWSVSEHIEVFSEKLDESIKRASECAEMSRSSTKAITRSINALEDEFQSKRAKMATLTGLPEDQLFTDGLASVGELIKSIRGRHHTMRAALASGQIRVAQSKETSIKQTIADVSDRLEISERVALVGSDALNNVEVRYDMLSGKLGGYKDLLKQIQKDYHEDVLIFAGERLCSTPDLVSNLLARVKLAVPKIDQALVDGQYLTAGRLLEEAAAELRFGELKVEATEQQFDAICLAAERCEMRHADARFRNRSLDSRMEDRRTRQSTLDRHQALTKQIESIEGRLTRSELYNPFRLQREVEEISQSIEQLEDRVVIDWDWHELASVSVKGAARAIRVGREKSLVLDGLKDGIDQWQEFLEQDHNDWRLAYQGGVDIELEVAGVLNARKCTKVFQKMEEGCLSVVKVSDWEDVAMVGINRSAGRDRFEKARIELVAGNIQKATAQATLAIQESRSELSSATTRLQFAAFEIAGRKRRQQMASILVDSNTDVFEFGRLTPKSMQVVQPLNAHHLRGFKSFQFEPLDNIVAFPEVQELVVARRA